MVYEVLMWLYRNNKMYDDIVIDEVLLESLPEDGVPEEILAIVRHKKDDGVAERE